MVGSWIFFIMVVLIISNLIFAFYLMSKIDWSQFQFEEMEKSRGKGFSIEASGGHQAFATCAMEIGFKKLAVGYSIQSPISQSLASVSIKSHTRSTIQLTMSF